MSAPFIDSLRRALQFCRFRGAPQDLAYSPRAFGLLLVASTAFDVAVGAALGETESAFGHSVLSTLVVLGLCATALAVRHLSNRFVQTASALVASGIVISVVQLPLLLLIEPVSATPAQPAAPMQVLLAWSLLVLLVWQVIVYAHIMRQALECGFGFAAALTTSWTIANLALARVFFGVDG